MKKTSFIILVFLMGILFANIVGAQDKNTKVLSDIEEYIKAGKNAPQALGQSIIDQLEKNSTGVTSVLLDRSKVAGISEQALSGYIWAIGFTKDINAVDDLIKISNTSKSFRVKYNVFQSLARIGGEKVGDYLLSQAKIANDDEDAEAKPEELGKFVILDCLAEVQYAPALPEMQTILQKDYKEYYWQQIFCFGKMGDKAIPFLLDKIDNNDVNTRLAAIALLGQTLMAEEAVKPLVMRYWKEKDPLIKKLILSSLERIMSNLVEMECFFKEVVEKEQEKDVKLFAEETITNLNWYREEIRKQKAKNKDNRELYKKEYDSLYKSHGHYGNFEILAKYSSFKDEPHLKKLRERILLRNSDECLYDYDKINKIIMFNRFIAKNEL